MKISKTGYKKNSKDKNQKSLMVPSGLITMKENDGKPLEKGRILGIDNLANVAIMEPGLDYSFPGSYVYEVPIGKAKNGGYILPGRFRNPEGNWLSKYDQGGPKKPGDVTRVATPASHFSIGYTSNPNIIYFHDTGTDTWTKFNEQQTANFRKTNPSYFTAAAPAPKPIAKPAPVKKQVPQPIARPVAKPIAKAVPPLAPAPAPVPKVQAPISRPRDPLMYYTPEETAQDNTRYAADPFMGKQMQMQQLTKEAEQVNVPVVKVAQQKVKQQEEEKRIETEKAPQKVEVESMVSSDEEPEFDLPVYLEENFVIPMQEAGNAGLNAILGVAEETARSIGDAYDSFTENESKDSFFSTLAPQIQYYREKNYGTDQAAESELQVFEDPAATAAPAPEQKQNIYSFDPKKVDLLSIDTDIDYGKGNSQFWGFRRTANNDDGFTYVPTPRKEKFGNGKGTANVAGMAHFLIESDLTDGYKSQGTTDGIERSIKHNQYIPAYKKDYNTGQVHMYYVKGKEALKEGYNYAANLRQLKLSDIDWHKSRKPAGYGKGVSNVLTKDGKDTFIVFKDADVDKDGIHRKMGRNNGNSLVFIIEKDGKRYIRDFAGTVTQIKNESKKITEEFGVPQDQVTLGFYDQGSYNAKPKAKDGFLPYSSYNSFHNSGVTGAGLAVPMYAYGGQISSGLPTKAYGGDISIPDLSRPNWLDKYQDGKQVERRDPNQLFFESPTESDTYQTQYSQPEVTVTPNWTEEELERNKLRDKYIADDQKAFRHWYDKLGYDKDNVTKRANQFAYNKLAKQYLKGDKENLTDEQKKFIGKSEYANRLQPSVGSRFVEGVTNPGFNLETVTNVLAPFEYPGNLVRGAVKGEFTDALKGQTPSPYFVSSDLAGTSPTQAAIASGLMTVGTDPLFLTGDEIFRGVGQGAKFLKRGNKLVDIPKQLPIAQASPEVVPPQLPVSSAPVSAVTPKAPAWSPKELPGLHLKSTIDNGPISKIVEPKTGLINVEQALAIIGKESGGSDKVALIKEALPYNISNKMDYNEFRQLVQNQIIPLERQFVDHKSNYGLMKLGYPKPKRTSYDYSIRATEDAIARGEDVEQNHLEELIARREQTPIENQTLILSNRGELGAGSNAHDNPVETLGHIHFLRDAETPDILAVTQIQSDAFQGTHRSMPQSFEDLLHSVRKQEEHAARLQDTYSRAKPKFDSELYPGAGKFRWYELEDGTVVSREALDDVQFQNDLVDLGKAHLKNYTQKSLIDKNHQERFLQEIVGYAGERGDINKLRLPTVETAAKVQGYGVQTVGPETLEQIKNNTFDDFLKIKQNERGRQFNENEVKFMKDTYAKIKDGKDYNFYVPEHQTILKKYAEQPKAIKKVFGIEPKMVTDSKGNTWYEFDIPKSFKEGKGQIKAFKHGGSTKWLDKYQVAGQVPANLPWINQQGNLIPFQADPPPQSLEDKVDRYLGYPMTKARMAADPDSGDSNDGYRHALASKLTAERIKENTGSSIAGVIGANMLGAAHEIAVLPKTIEGQGWYHGLRSSAEDMFNNAVGSLVGVVPYMPSKAKESFLLGLTDRNMLPDGVSMAKGDMYLKKKNGGIKSSGEGYYDYINGYSGIFANGGVSSKKSSWLNKYK
jgi:hypothetical protein